MTHAEKVTSIAAKFYEARRLLRSLTEPTMYAAVIRDYQASIRNAMVRHRCGDLDGAMHCIRVLQEKLPNSSQAQTWVMAAYVEMVEPSKPGER